jgi:iron complex transport system ATP-binding protein
MAKAVIAFEKVGFAYGARRVFEELSVAVAPGEMVALIGRNGSGKTTWLKLACGLLLAGRGAVLLEGRPIREMPRHVRARRVALVPQELHMPFPFSVYEMVMLGRTPYLGSWGTDGPADREAVRRALEVTETAEFADRTFGDLSAGERQRVLLAMALAQAPHILLLDEPTAHLDAAHQVWAFTLLRRLNRESGLTVVAAVHDLQLAAWFCDRLSVLHEGRLSADGPPAAVLRGPEVSEALRIHIEIRSGVSRPGHHVISLPETGTRG